MVAMAAVMNSVIALEVVAHAEISRRIVRIER
jgi:hypothetical protein